MRSLVLLFLFAFFAAPVSARECRLYFTIQQGENISTRKFNLCLLAEINDQKRKINDLKREINDLKREQKRFRRVTAEFERVIGEIPVDYLNEDGKVTVEPNRRIGKAIFMLSARLTGGANSLKVDQEILEELCSRHGRCEISIFFQAIDIRDSNPTNSVASGPCIFSYASSTGAWVRGEGCGSEGSLNGIDGDEAVAGPGQHPGVIAMAGGACLLAESDARSHFASGAQALQRDHAKGLFLIAIPSRREQGTRQFRCILEIQ